MSSKLSVDQMLMKARSHEKRDEITDAKKLYQAVLLSFPQNKRAQERLAALNKSQEHHVIKNPPQEIIDQLINLYNQGQFKSMAEQAQSLAEQYPKAFIIWNCLGVANLNSGDLEQASLAFKKVTELNPNYADGYNNLGVVLKDQGKLDEAIEVFDKALLINPNYANVHYNLGNSLQHQGKLDKAVNAYKKFILLCPHNAIAYNNMGVALQNQIKLDEAIEAYNKAISIKTDYAQAYCNLGNALNDKGKKKKAIEAYKKAISLKTDYAEAYNNMGVVLQDLNNKKEAIDVFKKCLSLKSDYAEAYFNIGSCLQNMNFEKSDPSLQKIIISLLDQKKYVRPQDITSSTISLLKTDSTLNKYLQLNDVNLSEFELLNVTSNLSNIPLLLKLMSVCPITDLRLEKLLVEIRAKILTSIKDLVNYPQVLKFQSALALQCFTNEYIYDKTNEEEKYLALLEETVKKELNNGNNPSSEKILCLASYKPLNEYEWSDLLIVNNEIKDVFTRQIIEPVIENNLKKLIPSLNYIKDNVSLKVRDQYESSPYPRWVNLKLRLKPSPISKIISQNNLKIFYNKIKDLNAPNILIAGCGTGQQSIETAARFKDSKVLAIDLSLSSLGYAKRKTKELNIPNIDYMHADILDLQKLNRKFDIVESVGVIHHMNNPLLGWKILTKCLKPGGLMRIGLYSELARKPIIEIRNEIINAGLGSSDVEMKKFRDMLIKSEKYHHKLIFNSPDIYCLSTMKDLLFHVQEHRFTIEQIQENLYNLGLKFCGFETKNIVSDFKLHNINKNDPYNLNKWKEFEEENTSAFVGMYQFWCQKII